MLQNFIRSHIIDTLYIKISIRYFLGFKDIQNKFHVETINEENTCLYYYLYSLWQETYYLKTLKLLLQIISYNTKSIKSYVVINQQFKDPKISVFSIWQIGLPWAFNDVENSNTHIDIY